VQRAALGSNEPERSFGRVATRLAVAANWGAADHWTGKYEWAHYEKPHLDGRPAGGPGAGPRRRGHAESCCSPSHAAPPGRDAVPQSALHGRDPLVASAVFVGGLAREFSSGWGGSAVRTLAFFGARPWWPS
jgi:hypothetical protein